MRSSENKRSYLNGEFSASNKHSVSKTLNFLSCDWLLRYISSISSIMFNKYGWVKTYKNKNV